MAVHVGLLAIEWNPFGDFPGVGKYEKLLLKLDKDDCYFMR